MSNLQDLRDKIHRLNGAEFKIRDLGKDENKNYKNIRHLSDSAEVTRNGIGRNTIYKATPSLKVRKSDKAPKLELKGWREVFPSMFNPVALRGTTTIYTQAMT